MSPKYLKLVIINLSFLGIIVSCGTRTGTGVTGTNPTGNGSVTVQSAAFNTNRSFRLFESFLAIERAISTFKFCVHEVKLENESGSNVESNGSSSIEMRLGLIDVSSGSVKTWGTPTLPTGFTLKRIKIKVEKDSELCGISKAIQFNSQSTEDGVEFKWEFSPNITLSNNDTLTLSLDTVVSTLNSAASSGQLNNESLKRFVEDSLGSASK